MVEARAAIKPEVERWTIGTKRSPVNQFPKHCGISQLPSLPRLQVNGTSNRSSNGGLAELNLAKKNCDGSNSRWKSPLISKTQNHAKQQPLGSPRPTPCWVTSCRSKQFEVWMRHWCPRPRKRSFTGGLTSPAHLSAWSSASCSRRSAC